MFFYLIVIHCVCDYPLQGDFLARAKNHRQPLAGVPSGLCLLAHALIHGGAVGMFTHSTPLGIAETAAHTLIDYGKCAGWFGFKIDQALHVACKLLWVAALGFIR